MTKHVFKTESHSEYPQYLFVEVPDKRYVFGVQIKHEDEGVVIDLLDEEKEVVATIGAAYADFYPRGEYISEIEGMENAISYLKSGTPAQKIVHGILAEIFEQAKGFATDVDYHAEEAFLMAKAVLFETGMAVSILEPVMTKIAIEKALEEPEADFYDEDSLEGTQ